MSLPRSSYPIYVKGRWKNKESEVLFKVAMPMQIGLLKLGVK